MTTTQRTRPRAVAKHRRPRVWARGALSVTFEPSDLRIGAYLDRRATYICPLPTLVVGWQHPAGPTWRRSPAYPRTRRLGRRLLAFFEPRDLRIGVFVDRPAVFVCLLPMTVLRFTRAGWGVR